MSSTKNVIITGSSRGIGFALVKLFAAAGHEVLAISRNTAPIRALRYPNVHTFSFDISKDEDLHRLSNFLKNRWEKVDILINNAGKILNKPFLETSREAFEAVYRVNVFGMAETIKSVVPFMPKDGHVLTISSMGGIQGSVKFPGLSAYSSAKAAVIGLTEVLAEEYKATGPSFNTLALGAVQTEMLAEAFPGYIAPVTAETMADYIFHFSLEGHRVYNGKVLQVSNSTP